MKLYDIFCACQIQAYAARGLAFTAALHLPGVVCSRLKRDVSLKNKPVSFPAGESLSEVPSQLVIRSVSI